MDSDLPSSLIFERIMDCTRCSSDGVRASKIWYPCLSIREICNELLSVIAGALTFCNVYDTIVSYFSKICALSSLAKEDKHEIT